MINNSTKKTIEEMRGMMYQQYISLCSLLESCETVDQIESITYLYDSLCSNWETKANRLMSRPFVHEKKFSDNILDIAKSFQKDFQAKLDMKAAMVVPPQPSKPSYPNTFIVKGFN